MTSQRRSGIRWNCDLTGHHREACSDRPQRILWTNRQALLIADRSRAVSGRSDSVRDGMAERVVWPGRCDATFRLVMSRRDVMGVT